MKLRVFFVFLFVWLLAAASASAQEKVDLNSINRIKAEAFENSKVMDHLFYLTDVHAPRISNSPGYRAGAEWTIQRLQEYGLENIHKETMAFGRGWSYQRFSAHLIEPQYAPL
ncbi:MAG: peptidase M28, partial [Acidobacteria bacterium]|nr:peptidase M28 [Acidobacteriota bacterium]